METEVRIHLVTVVGADLQQFPHMLNHYAEFGFDSLLVNVHLDSCASSLLDEVTIIARKFGAEIDSVFIGKWLQSVNPFLYAHTMRQRPRDWFVLADSDEFQVYPANVREFLSGIDSQGFDYVEGCVIDRVARNGGFPEIVNKPTIWEQFPLAGLVTYPILGGNILKVVACKGRVSLGPGQHSAHSGRGCPRNLHYIPVHHFKWCKGVVDRLRRRIEFYKAYDEAIWRESQRFIHYIETHDGKIDIFDPQYFLAESTSEYPLWPIVKDYVLSAAKIRGL